MCLHDDLFIVKTLWKQAWKVSGSWIRWRALKARGSRCCPFCKLFQLQHHFSSLCFVGSPDPWPCSCPCSRMQSPYNWTISWQSVTLHQALGSTVDEKCMRQVSAQESHCPTTIRDEDFENSYTVYTVNFNRFDPFWVFIVYSSGAIWGFMHMYYSFGLTNWWTSGMIMYRLGAGAFLMEHRVVHSQ